MTLFGRFISWFANFPRSRWEEEPCETIAGIHIISDMGLRHTYAGDDLSQGVISSIVRGLDWERGFHQVVVVTRPGVSMEVGGSLCPEHGLAAVYRNRPAGLEVVHEKPPSNVAEMEALLFAFVMSEGEEPSEEALPHSQMGG